MARNEADNYPTPQALADLGWRIAANHLVAVAADKTISVCEPGCGDAQPFLVAAARDPRVRIPQGCDLRAVTAAHPRFAVDAGTDWTARGMAEMDGGPWDVILTNPPFSAAEAFARAALRRVAPGGVVVFLTRMSFLGSQGRRAFWAEHPPTEVCVIRPRPSFSPDGNTDTAEYCFLVWRPSAAAQRISFCDWAKPKRGRVAPREE